MAKYYVSYFYKNDFGKGEENGFGNIIFDVSCIKLTSDVMKRFEEKIKQEMDLEEVTILNVIKLDD